MKIKSFPIVMLILVCAMIANGQRKQSIRPTQKDQATAEITRLRDQYIKATKEYKASLQKLLTLYQDGVRKAEGRVNQSQRLLAEGLMSKPDVERNEQALADAKAKVSGVEQQIANADTQTAQTLLEIEKPETNAELVRQYRRASARQPSCRNWTLTTYRRETRRSTTVAIKLVCQH